MPGLAVEVRLAALMGQKDSPNNRRRVGRKLGKEGLEMMVIACSGPGGGLMATFGYHGEPVIFRKADPKKAGIAGRADVKADKEEFSKTLKVEDDNMNLVKPMVEVKNVVPEGNFSEEKLDAKNTVVLKKSLEEGSGGRGVPRLGEGRPRIGGRGRVLVVGLGEKAVAEGGDGGERRSIGRGRARQMSGVGQK